MVTLQKQDTAQGYACAYECVEETFVADEVRAKEDFLSLRGNERFCLYRALSEGDTVGWIGLWRLEDFCLVEYLVVRADRRGRGIGSAILQEVLNHVGQSVVLEVDPPGTDADSAPRIRFYERMGFRLNAYAYEQPPYAAEKQPVSMLLMSYPAPLSPEDFVAVRHSIYETVYAGFRWDGAQETPSESLKADASAVDN